MHEVRKARLFQEILKFNPYHGKDGRFTSAPGSGAGSGGGLDFSKLRFNTFMYNNQRCHAQLIPGMKREHLIGDEKYIGELDGYEIYQIPSLLFDQHGFIGIKKSSTFNDIIKFNPYHDRLGRFTTPGSAASFTYKPGQGKMYDNAIAREKERTASMGAGAKEEGFRPAKSREEAVEYAKTKLNIPNVDYGDLDIETINHINQEISAIQKKFPELREAVNGIERENRKNVYAAAGTNVSGTNTLYIGSYQYGKGIQRLKQNYQNDVDSGFHPENTDYRSIIWHEFGHIYAHMHYKTSLGYDGKTLLGYMDRFEYREKVIGRSYEKEAVRTAAKSLRISQKELKRRISRYAEKEPAETFAEAFAEYNCSPNPRPECIAIMKAAGIIK